MKRRRKVIVEIATSADGYIARLDGHVSWLDRPQPKGHYGMGAFMKSIDTILWGRKTYTKGIEMGMKDGGFGPKRATLAGIPQQRSIPLKLLATKKFPDGVVRLHYRVLKQRRLPKVTA